MYRCIFSNLALPEEVVVDQNYCLKLTLSGSPPSGMSSHRSSSHDLFSRRSLAGSISTPMSRHPIASARLSVQYIFTSYFQIGRQRQIYLAKMSVPGGGYPLRRNVV